MTEPSKAWGATRSQHRLDRRIRNIRARFTEAGVMHNVDLVNEHYEAMRSALDEAGVRKLAEEGERAAAIVERAVSGGRELLEYLDSQRAAGVFDPTDDEAHSSAIDTFYRQKRGGLNSGATRVKNLVRMIIALVLVVYPVVILATDHHYDSELSRFVAITQVIIWAVILGIRLVQRKFRIFLVLVLRSACMVVLAIALGLWIITVQALLSDDGIFEALIFFVPGLPVALLLVWFLWDDRRSHRR